MFCVVAALVIAPCLAPQKVYIPAAKTSMIFLDNLAPVLLDPDERTDDQKSTGCAASYKWEGSSPYLTTRLSYYTYASAPLKSTRELAGGMFTSSKELAEGVAKATKSDDILEAFKQKFTERTVSERKVGNYSGWLDSHEDKLAKSWRRYLSWGDSKEQWCLELVGSSEVPPVKDMLRLILDSVTPTKFDDAEVIKSLALQPQKLPGLMCSISTPGVFQVYRGDPLDTSRSGGEGYGANMPMGPISAVIYASKYRDSAISPTLQTAQSLQKNTITPDMIVRGSKVRAVTLAGVAGHEFSLYFDDGGAPTYYCGVALAQNGNEWIIHVQASNAAGGEKKVRAILESFRPE